MSPQITVVIFMAAKTLKSLAARAGQSLTSTLALLPPLQRRVRAPPQVYPAIKAAIAIDEVMR